MDYNMKVCASNIVFCATMMGCFLVTRRKVFVSNAFRTKLSPLCLSILKYENSANIKTTGQYLKKMAIYLTLQTTVMYGLNNIQKVTAKANSQQNKNLDKGQLIYQINFGDILNKEKPEQNKQSSKFSYRVNPSKLINPILFCSIFKMPISLGFALGLTANHIDTNVLNKLVDML